MIELTDEERAEVEGFIRRGKANARNVTRAHVLLKSADGWSRKQLVETFGVSEATVGNVRKRYREGGVEGVVKDKVQSKRRRALSGAEEALVVAMACSPVPDGHDHWTLRMLRDQLVELEVVESISAATIHRLLKKMNLNPGSGNSGVSRKRST
jgi:transposase